MNRSIQQRESLIEKVSGTSIDHFIHRVLSLGNAEKSFYHPSTARLPNSTHRPARKSGGYEKVG